MEYTIITPIEMTIAAADATATTTISISGLTWILLAVLIIGFIVCVVMATREYERSQSAQNQASPIVA